MVYAYLGKNSIKVLSLTKTLLGQYTISHFAKTYSSAFIEAGNLVGADLTASALKEAFTSAQPQPINDKDVALILPQEVFTYARYTVPQETSQAAIAPFLKDKVGNELGIQLENTYHDYIVQGNDKEKVVLFYAIDEAKLKVFSDALQLIQLKIARVIPETLAYYTLFEKTLRKDKKENILYASYDKDSAHAYMYDSYGLLKDQKHYLESDVKASLKEVVQMYEKDEGKVNRLILSGTESSSVRQDLFTKEVGAWTNPLEKIIDNFYQDYLKVLVPDESKAFSVLMHDVNLGAFIFSETHDAFTLTSQPLASGSRKLPSMPKVGLGLPSGMFGEIFNLKTIGIFIVSFVLSFGIIFGISKISGEGFSIQLPSIGGNEEVPDENTPTPTPTLEPTPTPSVTREDLTVKILNGSGIAGKAGDVQDILEEAGYTDIVTGNADTFDYETTEIQLNEDAQDALSYLQEDLADYVEITEASETDEDEEADVIIIVGTDFE